MINIVWVLRVGDNLRIFKVLGPHGLKYEGFGPTV